MTALLATGILPPMRKITWLAAPAIIGQAFEDGFQQRSDVELNLGAYVGKVARKPRTATSS